MCVHAFVCLHTTLALECAGRAEACARLWRDDDCSMVQNCRHTRVTAPAPRERLWCENRIPHLRSAVTVMVCAGYREQTIKRADIFLGE